ncbi:MAG: TraB/GumN family protein [Chitinophagaceae bacterium]|nr:TraB/GumN family protein [Chitinophagaceae bacterium]
MQKYSGSMLDGYFAETGKLAGKKITEFETIEEQMNVLFNSSTNEQQVNQLKLFLRNKTEMINQGNGLIENWFKHDLDKMYAVSEKGLAVFGNENDFLKKRNDKWMQTIPGLMKKESQFIAVGALHLAGPYGLVKQLQQLGYTLTPIKL